jgi:hypothetical protein
MIVARAFGLSALGGGALELLEPARSSAQARPAFSAQASVSAIDEEVIAPIHRGVVRLLPVPPPSIRLGTALAAHRVPFARPD